jgi:hypothetical protein
MTPKDAGEIESLKRYLDGEREGAIWAEEGSLDEVEALHFLRRFGGAKRLNEFLESGARVLELCPWAGLTDDEAAQFQDGFRAVSERVRNLYDTAERIESDLRARGWEFNAETKTLKQATGKAGRKRDLFNERVREEYERYQTKNENKPGVKENTQEVRDHIATLLAHIFHPSVNDPRPRGPISNAINTHLNP